MQNRRPGSIADRVFCAKSATAVFTASHPQTRAGVGAPDLERNIEEKSVSDMVAPGASHSGDQPTCLLQCELIAASHSQRSET
jgi:hypothetical protein